MNFLVDATTPSDVKIRVSCDRLIGEILVLLCDSDIQAL